MMTLMFLQQYSGINAILFYLQAIFDKAGTEISTGLQATIVSLDQVFIYFQRSRPRRASSWSHRSLLRKVLATGLSMFIVDRFGRKILLIISDAIMAVSILALGIYFYLDANIEVICDDTSEGTTARIIGKNI